MPKKAEKKETTEQISEETVVKDVAVKNLQKSYKNKQRN